MGLFGWARGKGCRGRGNSLTNSLTPSHPCVRRGLRPEPANANNYELRWASPPSPESRYGLVLVLELNPSINGPERDQRSLAPMVHAVRHAVISWGGHVQTGHVPRERLIKHVRILEDHLQRIPLSGTARFNGRKSPGYSTAILSLNHQVPCLVGPRTGP